VIGLNDLSASIWTWYRDGDKWMVEKIIDIPAEPADRLAAAVAERLQSGAPLVTDIDGAGELRSTPNSLSNGLRRIGRIRSGSTVAIHPRTAIVSEARAVAGSAAGRSPWGISPGPKA
jgi:56kDa selenium binding protein (SBP56)